MVYIAIIILTYLAKKLAASHLDANERLKVVHENGLFDLTIRNLELKFTSLEKTNLILPPTPCNLL